MQDKEKFSKQCIEQARKNAETRRPMLREFARAMDEVLSPRSVVDVGSGPGFLLEYWAERDRRVDGLEFSAEESIAIAADSVRDAIQKADITQWGKDFPFPYRYDLAVSLQVAEHVHPDFADDMVVGMTRLADTILFSAAEPGQRGIGHVNCQTMDYWTKKFLFVGYRTDHEAIDAWRDEIQAPFNDGRHGQSIRKNVMIYRRKI